MEGTLIKRFMDVLESTPLESPAEDFARTAFALFALALSKVSATEREARLQGLEDGDMRKSVEEFAKQAAQWIQ
jgi:hypothetical protein